MILPTYSAFRWHFSAIARTTNVLLTYDHVAVPSTISRASGSFITDGFNTDMSLQVSGTATNDATYLLQTVAALQLTLADGYQLDADQVVVSSLVGFETDADGAEKWPTTLVRANGFSSTFALNISPIVQLPVTLTVNAGVTDAVAGTSYTWYVRQRTDDTSLKWLSVSHASAASTGTITLALTVKATTDLDLLSLDPTVKLSGEQQLRLLRNVTVFCKRDSDGAIQFVDLLQLSHGGDT